MARRKTKTDPNIRVRVIKEHAGIKVGEVLVKPTAIAKRMIELGYYEAAATDSATATTGEAVASSDK